MASDKKSAKSIVKEAEEMLFLAFLGFDLVQGDDARARMAGLRNIAVFGRAVMNMLPNLRSIAPSFDEWYEPYVEVMKKDQIMRYFDKLRKKIIKEGELHISSTTPLKKDLTEVLRQFKPPPHAKSFFIGDVTGGSGWVIETGTGAVEKFYVQMPASFPTLSLDFKIHLVGAPAELQDLLAVVLCERYLNKLYELVAEAKIRFR